MMDDVRQVQSFLFNFTLNGTSLWPWNVKYAVLPADTYHITRFNQHRFCCLLKLRKLLAFVVMPSLPLPSWTWKTVGVCSINAPPPLLSCLCRLWIDPDLCQIYANSFLTSSHTVICVYNRGSNLLLSGNVDFGATAEMHFLQALGGIAN